MSASQSQLAKVSLNEDEIICASHMTSYPILLVFLQVRYFHIQTQTILTEPQQNRHYAYVSVTL